MNQYQVAFAMLYARNLWEIKRFSIWNCVEFRSRDPSVFFFFCLFSSMTNVDSQHRQRKNYKQSSMSTLFLKWKEFFFSRAQVLERLTKTYVARNWINFLIALLYIWKLNLTLQSSHTQTYTLYILLSRDEITIVTVNFLFFFFFVHPVTYTRRHYYIAHS